MEISPMMPGRLDFFLFGARNAYFQGRTVNLREGHAVDGKKSQTTTWDV